MRMCVLCGCEEEEVGGLLWDRTFIWETVTYQLCVFGPGSTRLGEQEVAESETGNRKLLARMICTHWLWSTSREQQQTRTWNCVGVCACVCRWRKRKALDTDSGLRPDCTLLKPKNHNIHYVCVCWTLTSAWPFRHLQYHRQSALPENITTPR